MAKVIYFRDPVDETKVVEIISKGTLNNALKELGIEKDPLCVTINGMTPDDVDVETILDDTDIVEIRRMVHGGGGDSRTKSTLATVVQIAALVALAVPGLQPFAIYILAGAQVVAGALNKWAQDLANANAPNADVQDASVQANDYSPKSATNKARPLAPITIPMGEHRYAPDVHADVLMQRYGDKYVPIAANPYLNSYEMAGLISSNGPMAPDNSWAIMPAEYIATGFPAYPIKIAPLGWTTKTTALTPSENTAIINAVRDKILFDISEQASFTNLFHDNIGALYAKMGIIYHFDPADPLRGRFNFMWALSQAFIVRYTTSVPTSPTVWTMLEAVYNGTFYTLYGATPSLRMYGPFAGEEPYYYDPLMISTGGTLTLPPNLQSSAAPARVDEIRNYLLSLNNGAFTTSDKINSPTTPAWYFSEAIRHESTGIPVSTQVFNYGIGDIEVDNRQVGDTLLGPSNSILDFVPIEKTGTEKWTIPYLDKFNKNFYFFEDVKNFPRKELINNSPTSYLVDKSDQGLHNFIYFAGKYGMDYFRFAISGRLYATTGSGFTTNTTHLQVQFKFSDAETWNVMPLYNGNFEVLTIQNNNTQNIYLPYSINISRLTGIENVYLEVRIRKVTPDIDDNISTSASSSKISQLAIVDASFYQSDLAKLQTEASRKNIPMNLEGLAIDALISDSARTNQYTADVKAKCWVFDFDTQTWSWTFSRNPAFWFLFFARGGFLNESADGQYSWPYSPTYGWVNYPDHPQSTEHIFGGGYRDEEIDIDKILEWAYFCEEQNLKMDMVLRDDTSVADVLERIANIGRASVTYNVGVLSVVIEDPAQVPTSMFGMGNIKSGTFSVEYSVGDPVRRVVGVFTNKDKWESDEVEALVPYSDPSVVKEIQITLDGIVEKSQAQREINILAARQFYQRRIYSWETDFQGRTVKRGDLVYLSHDSTQYGFSGRVMDFVVENGSVVGLRSGSIIDSSVKYITVMAPDETMMTYECSFNGDMIVFVEPYDLEDASFYVNTKEENPLSRFPKSIPEDFVFIADIKETTGKIVRISEVQALSGGDFKFTAVDEDPAMWAYEFNNVIPPESMDDSILIARVYNVGSVNLGNGRVEILWELDGAERVEIINLNTGLPITANGNYSFSGGSVVLDLIQGVKYDLELRPLAFGQPYKENRETLTVWPL